MDETTAARPAASAVAKRGRIRGLEGPRGLGCASVIVTHVGAVHATAIMAKTHLEFLGQALTFFFCLSGFLLYMPLVKRYVEHKSMPDTAQYYRNRVKRIFPGYLAIFLLVNFVFGAAYVVNPVIAGWENYDVGTGTITDPGTLIANLTLTQSLFPSTLQTGINPTWSLTTEWGFYLIVPLVGYLLIRMGRTSTRRYRAALIPAFVLIVMGITVAIAVDIWVHHTEGIPPLWKYWGPNWVSVAGRSFFAQADHFAWGMIVAVIFVHVAKGGFPQYTTKQLQAYAATVMFVFTGISMVVFSFGSLYYSSVFAIACAGLITMIVIPYARGEDSWIASVTDFAPLKYMGTISLSAYVWHYPVIILMGRWGFPFSGTASGLIIGSVAAILITAAAGSITYYLVERPAMRWGT